MKKDGDLELLKKKIEKYEIMYNKNLEFDFIFHHVKVQRVGYQHHGLKLIFEDFVGIVHFSALSGPTSGLLSLPAEKRNAIIKFDQYDDEFVADPKGKIIVHATKTNDTDAFGRLLDVIEEAASQSYNLFLNNCEHLVNMIMNGIPSSQQVQTAVNYGTGIFLGAAALFGAYKLITGANEEDQKTKKKAIQK